MSKPPANWADTDVDDAELGLAELARDFVRREAFAHVKGRRDKRHAIAVMVGTNSRDTPSHREFDVSDIEQPAVEALIDRNEESLTNCDGQSERLVLAALAELSARRMRAG